MKRYLPGSTVAAALLATALFVSATGGAVAGSLITGKQIKDGSVTGKDLKDKSVSAADLASNASVPGPAGPPGAAGVIGPPGPAGVNVLSPITQFGTLVGPGTPTTTTVNCPSGQKATGGVGWWFASAEPVKFVLFDGLSGGVASSDGSTAAQNVLIARVICIPATIIPEP